MENTRMRQAVVCGIDIGSTNSKVVALDESGLVVARSKRVTPRNDADLSIDAEQLFAAIEEMMLEVCGDEYVIHAVAAAGVGEDGVLVDSAFRPLGLALAWFDPRRTRLFQSIAAGLDDDSEVGVASDPSRTIVGWLWAASQPGADRASAWVALTDFASARWSSNAFISDTLAARTAAWVSSTRSWLPQRVDLTLGDERLLPSVVRTGDIVGRLASEHLAAAGVLADGAVVVAGGHDHPIGGWGVDQMHPGAILDSMGTAEVVVAQSHTATVPRRNGVDVAPGIRGDGTTLLRVEELARNFDWASQDPAVADALRKIIGGSEHPDRFVDSESFVPGEQGGGRPRYTATAPASAHSRASSVVGALARLGGAAIDAVAADMPSDSAVYAAGGWARSRGWLEVKQAVTGRSMTVIAEPEVTAVGAALLAASALDWNVSAALALGESNVVTRRQS